MANLSQFDLGSAARIGRVVKAVEQEPRRTKPLGFAPVIEAGRRGFRICTFTGGWLKGANKTVTFKYQTSTPNTVTATNLFADVPASGDCAIAREGGTWFLIAAECDS
jgi:hypothetical protein